MVPACTPGPWTVDDVAPGVTDELEITAQGFSVASVWGGIDVQDDTNPTMHANARLIVAAPELLDALTLVLPLAEQFLAKAPGHPDNAKLETARAALVKAQARP
jgi:hypothetical protein